ncbi:hypothetical protein FQN54_001727 [Arachnomyces sp. PD_36]|nr:hypothetical protein FQN54_001727 [Arachnomyces sp. PD_36]
MAMQYINQIRSKARSVRVPKKHPSSTEPVAEPELGIKTEPEPAPASASASPSTTPVLTKEDEAFLHRVTSHPKDEDEEGESGGAAGKGKDAQVALMDGAQDIPLPMSPPENEDENGEGSRGLGVDEKDKDKDGKLKGEKKKEKGKGKNRWSIFGVGKRKSVHEVEVGESSTDKSTADVKAKKAEGIDDKEVEEEKDDLTEVLEGLNLSAVNNRAFSVSEETQELLRKFKVVFTDLVRGVPTAYDDLESLLTNGDQQLQKSYNHLPGFLQKLVEQLPDKVTEKIGPEVLAAAAEKAGSSGVNMENAGKAAGAAGKMGFKTPSLKDLVGKPGAIAGMLRSIMTFLQQRFPAIVGMNVLWSLALSILLFVFWYCHKRGREVRLERERLLTEQEVAQLEAEYESGRAGVEGLSTTAPEGAPIDAVQDGVREVQRAREDQWKENKGEREG